MNTVTITAGEIRPGTVIEHEGRRVGVLSATPWPGRLPHRDRYSENRCDYAGCDGALGLGTVVAIQLNQDRLLEDPLLFHTSHRFTANPAPLH